MPKTKLVYGLTQEFIDTLNANGYVIVPKEPTSEMWAAGEILIGPSAGEWAAGDARDIYQAMLNAHK